MINRLESLELQGLKTFATLTRLEFPGHITAIVGPNGSGKSNIADCVRWVLGEQAFTLLRAKRTEDMIFSGSQQRSRAGMALATITFNNVDGWLPIDYSMVSISRRAYRDGQNEYLLNGQKVRLKDIAELLSQTGLAERTYTIIGQGLVDVALALKPDERRKLFEEAAGIGLYRSRKEDALRRLVDTHRNLDRVLDILSEIKPRLRSLERQAGRFVEYEHLRSDLQEHLRIWYGYHWHQKQLDLNKALTAFQEQETLLETLRNKYNESETEVLKIHEELLNTRESLESSQAELAQYHHRIDKITREIAIIEERQSLYQHQKGNLEIDITQFQEGLSKLVSQEQVFGAEINQHKAEFSKAVEEVNQAEVKLTEVSAKQEASQAKLDIARQTRVNLQTRKVQISVRLEESEHRLESLSKEQNKIVTASTNLNEEKRVSFEKESAVQTELEEIQKTHLNLKNKLNTQSESLDGAYDEKRTLEQKIAAQETKLAKVTAQLEVLKQAEEALSGYSEGSKSIVEGSQQGRLPSGIEPLSKFIIVEERYERAISAALGELTDLLVMPSGGKDILLKYLETKGNDRVALVVKDEVQSQAKSLIIKNKDGFHGYASDLIKVEPRYRDLIDKLFCDTVVVQDRLSAQKILPNLIGAQKVVTLNGLVFQANGVMISGQSSSGKRISRSRRRREMHQAVENTTIKINQFRVSREKISHAIKELEDGHHSLTQKIRQFEDAQSKILQQHQQLKDILTRMDEQLSWHKDQLLEINQNLLENRTKKELTESELEGCNVEITRLLEEEKVELDILNELSVFELQQKLNYWQTHRIVTQSALEAAQQRSQDHYARLQEAQKRLNLYQSRLSNLEDNIIEIRKNETQLKQDAENLTTTIETINSQQFSPLAKAVNDLEEKTNRLEAVRNDVHNEVTTAERQLTQLQLEMMHKNDQMANLTEKIEDDFSVVAVSNENKNDPALPFSTAANITKALPKVDDVPENIEIDIKSLKGKLRRMGALNPEVQQEYTEVKERYEFLESQVTDLKKASENLQEVIEALDELMERDFLKTFKSVGQGFAEYFKRLFKGGEAKLLISDEENPVEGGIDLVVRLPGRRQQGLALLSGGERSLTAVALIFALLNVSPTPFCILDEVDAMLDEFNVGRFIELLRELSHKTQFIIITHNRNTVQAADVIYGVTMGRDSTSQMISLKLEEVDDTYVD
ncbi:MAG: chromosome segregation protein SMC [Chloroflexota bacterium]|nr:chromosome segregation protein SMC [Chloroflexota bacterium]